MCGGLDGALRQRLVKCFVRSVTLYGDGMWTLKKENEKRLEDFKMWTWRRMVKDKMGGVDKVKNEDVK